MDSVRSHQVDNALLEQVRWQIRRKLLRCVTLNHRNDGCDLEVAPSSDSPPGCPTVCQPRYPTHERRRRNAHGAPGLALHAGACRCCP